MSKQKKTSERGEQLEPLRARVAELEETLRAIRTGEVDAVLVNGPDGERVFTLQGAEHAYRLLVETIDEGAATLSADGMVLYSNKSFAGIFNVPLEKFIGSPLESFVSGDDLNRLRSLIREGKKATSRGEIRLDVNNGRPRTVRLTLSPNRELGLESICAVATELTGLMETNEALRVTEASLRNLSARLLQLQDDERRRIARDLHDITGQQVAALVMSLDRLTHLIDCPNPEAKQTIADSRELVGKIGEEIRTLSYLLHPPLLDECGLASAVRWYAEGFQKRSGIRLDVEIDSKISRFPIDAETTLFRVVQESLTNVHRYSGSADAQIRISANSDQVQLEVIDHGKGGKVSSNYAALQGPAPLGVGIPGMRERLHQLGGRLDVEFGINGTRVVAILPIKKAEATDGPTAIEAAAQVASQRQDDVNQNHLPDHDTRRRILIADDHEVMRRGVRGLIESQEEWAVCGEAVEGADAVKKFLDLRPELVILDINMPGLSGLDAAQQILRENEATKILFFTVHDSEQVIREVARIGAQGYVTKSRAGHDLVDAVRNVLDGKTFFRGLAAEATRKSVEPKPRVRAEQLAAARTSSQA